MVGGDTGLRHCFAITPHSSSSRPRSTVMASSMSGMFLGQQQSAPHPSGGPGGPGQPGMLSGPPGARGSNSNTLVDDLEAAFEVRTLATLLASSGSVLTLLTVAS